MVDPSQLVSNALSYALSNRVIRGGSRGTSNNCVGE